MNSKLLLLFAIVCMAAVSYSTNIFAESEANSETIIPNVFDKEDYMILDLQNYSYGDDVCSILHNEKEKFPMLK